jgi:hypothetical protein
MRRAAAATCPRLRMVRTAPFSESGRENVYRRRLRMALFASGLCRFPSSDSLLPTHKFSHRQSIPDGHVLAFEFTHDLFFRRLLGTYHLPTSYLRRPPIVHSLRSNSFVQAINLFSATSPARGLFSLHDLKKPFLLVNRANNDAIPFLRKLSTSYSPQREIQLTDGR